MRVFVFHWKDITHPYAGGAERLLHHFMTETTKLGHCVTWFCSKYDHSTDEEIVDGIRIVRRGGQFLVYLHAAFIYFRYRKKTDVVIDSITGIPWFTMLYSSKPTLAIIYHLGKRETFFTELPAQKGMIGYFFAFVGWFSESIIPFLYKKTKIMTFSEDTRKDIVHLGIPEGHVHVAQEGIDLSKHKPIKTRGNSPNVVCVGRLVRNKGVEYLITAMKCVVQQIPNVKLYIIGVGPFRAKLEEIVESLGLKKNVTFLGFVSEEKKIGYLQRATVLVLPSLREGWATPVIEANACGTPAIGADVTGVNTAIVEGVTGFVFPYGNVRELANKILKILCDPKLTEEMGTNSYIWAQRFDKKLTLERFFQIIGSLF